MLAVYNKNYRAFDTKTLQKIHYDILAQIYDWAGEFRSIQIAKYSFPKQIKKELDKITVLLPLVFNHTKKIKAIVSIQ